MSFNGEQAIQAFGVTKYFSIYDKPVDRLKSIFFGSSKNIDDKFIALNNVSLSIPQGQTVGIIGKNGSGKSTLLQIICGTLASDKGSINTTGRIAALLELGSGFNPDFTGRDNVFLYGAVLGLTRKEIENRFDQILTFAEIGEFIDRPMKTYSSGMYVRLAFAVAINVSPDILIIDEALAVGDARFQAKCFNKIQEIKESGSTILFVTHDVSSIRQLCDQAIWLDSGEVRMVGDVLGVTSKYMEFMFREETVPNNSKENVQDETACDIEDVELIEIEGIDTSKPINHWGENKGCIQSCILLNKNGKRTVIFSDDEYIEVKIRLRLPKNIKYDSFGVGIAFRSLYGTDLVVYDTFGQGLRFIVDQDYCELSISLINPLNEGKYLLVVNVEDRSKHEPFYYEFIEGIDYFSILRSNKHFGLFIPSVNCNIKYKG